MISIRGRRGLRTYSFWELPWWQMGNVKGRELALVSCISVMSACDEHSAFLEAEPANGKGPWDRDLWV